MVPWEKKAISVKDLGECLYLDSGTTTPLLKRLESKGYIRRERSSEDEIVVIISITDCGESPKEEAAEIPQKLGACVRLDPAEAIQLYTLLYKVLRALPPHAGE